MKMLIFKQAGEFPDVKTDGRSIWDIMYTCPILVLLLSACDHWDGPSVSTRGVSPGTLTCFRTC